MELPAWATVLLTAVFGTGFSLFGIFELWLKPKIEGAIQQELSRAGERQQARFSSYGALWEILKPLAIYSNEEIGRHQTQDLSKRLTEWYFSKEGGMFMTPHVREVYFALQNLLHVTGNMAPDWRAERYNGELLKQLQRLLENRGQYAATQFREVMTRDDLSNWPFIKPNDCKEWGRGVAALADDWQNLNERERFVVLQQVGSVLRSALANDVQSRLQ
jgi:hypothetical protein